MFDPPNQILGINILCFATCVKNNVGHWKCAYAQAQHICNVCNCVKCFAKQLSKEDKVEIKKIEYLRNYYKEGRGSQ